MTEFTLPDGELEAGEEWRFIPDFAHGYAISNYGRVISYRRRMPAFLAWNINNLRGYYASVNLAHPETKAHTRHRIHALVLESFIGPRPANMDIRHLDGNPLNNHLGNLAYGTKQENMQDTLAHGTHNNASKTHCKRGHIFDDENTIRNAHGKRFCRTCTKARNDANLERAAMLARERRAANREQYNRYRREYNAARKLKLIA